MDVYSLLLRPSVEKDLERLPRPTFQRILRKIEALPTDPIPAQSVKLSGTEYFYRLRAGDYRVIYSVNRRDKKILVHHVRHRRDVYRNL